MNHAADTSLNTDTVRFRFKGRGISGLSSIQTFIEGNSTLPSSPVLPPPLPLRPLLIITPTELSILITLISPRAAAAALQGRRPGSNPGEVRPTARDIGHAAGALDKVALVQHGVLVLLDQVPEPGVPGVDELEGRQAALVPDARVRPGLEHHLHQGVAELALRLGLAVDPPYGRVEGRVALEPVGRVALEVVLVEEEVDDLVCDGWGWSVFWVQNTINSKE